MASPLVARVASAAASPAVGAQPSCVETAASAAVAAFACPQAEEPLLDANRLHVYHVALELHCLCSTLAATLNRIVKDQLERASLSVVLNIAEAAGRRSRRDKARFYAIARGSATDGDRHGGVAAQLLQATGCVRTVGGGYEEVRLELGVVAE